MMNWLPLPSRPSSAWTFAGMASSFPDLGPDLGSLEDARLCGTVRKPGCKIFRVPKTDPSQSSEVPIIPENGVTEDGLDLQDQVVVFQFRNRFHAVDHRCPHSSFPLSKGMAFDIEDFGVALSAGLSCPKHGWSFDIFTGMADRNAYKLNVWDVKLQSLDGKIVPNSANSRDVASEHADVEVWVRRKQRMG